MRVWSGVVGSLLAVVVLSACAATTSESSDGGSAGSGGDKVAEVSFDIDKGAETPAQPVESWCGDKKVKVGLAVAQGVNSWMKTLRYQVDRAAKECSSIDGPVLFTSAGGDQQRAISQISSQVAQGVDVLLVQADFGAAELPAIRSAHKAGVKVIVYNSAIGGTPGTDFTAQTILDGPGAGAAMATKIGKTVKNGNVVFLGGIPGAASSKAMLDGIKKALEDYPDLTLVTKTPVTTNWTAAGAQQAMAGLIAKTPDIDAVITDYGVTARGAIEAFKLAGKPVPPISTVSTDNQFGCAWKKLADQGTKIPVFSFDGGTWMGEIALRQGVAAATDKTYNPHQNFTLPPFDDTTTNNNPPCNPHLPPDADLSAGLTTTQLTTIFK